MPSNHHASLNSKHTKKDKMRKNKHRHYIKQKKKNRKIQLKQKPEYFIATNTPLNTSDAPTEIIANDSVKALDDTLSNYPENDPTEIPAKIPANDPAETPENDSAEAPVNIYEEKSLMSAESFTSSAALGPSQDGIKTIPSSNASRVTQIVAPIISVFGGIALVAVAMFYVARKKKRRSIQKAAEPDHKDLDHEDKLHDIPLNDDEAIVFHDNDESKAPMGLSYPMIPFQYQQKDTSYQHHFEEPHMNEYYQEQATRESIYYNSLDYQSSLMSDTLVESHITTRSNSVSTKKTLSVVTKPTCINTRPSSVCSSIYTDALVSPTSTVIGAHISSFLMIAERQQLQHEKPNIFLEYSRSTPIETYKAQLSQIVDPDEEEEQGVDIPIAFPFYSVIDLNTLY